MAETVTLGEILDTAIDRHAEILVDLDRVARRAESLNATEPEPADFDRLLAQVGELRQTLGAHFRAEEASDLYGRLKRLLPDARGSIERLIGEHAAVLEELDSLLLEVRHCTPVNAERMSRSLAGLLQTLITHEATEDQLMTEAFGDTPPRRRRQPIG